MFLIGRVRIFATHAGIAVTAWRALAGSWHDATIRR
jgi:hypothetical protein